MFDFLPSKVIKQINGLNINLLYEIRFRAEKNVIIEYGDTWFYLTKFGISKNNDKSIVFSKNDLKNMLFNICERSLYAYTDKITKGFVTLENGVRIGLCGECVLEDSKIINVKNVTSLNVRFPHSVKGCSKPIFKHMFNCIKNVLVIAPVGVGKTTIVRDLAEELSIVKHVNVLVVDERNEIFPLILDGDTIDCIKYSPKSYAFENGIRAMCPQVIVTDEISGKNDLSALKYAKNCGVSIIATMHGDSVISFQKMEETHILSKIFDIFVFLSSKNGKGTIDGIYDNKFKLINDI